jgi:hypothetical protein
MFPAPTKTLNRVLWSECYDVNVANSTLSWSDVVARLLTARTNTSVESYGLNRFLIRLTDMDYYNSLPNEVREACTRGHGEYFRLVQEHYALRNRDGAIKADSHGGSSKPRATRRTTAIYNRNLR